MSCCQAPATPIGRAIAAHLATVSGGVPDLEAARALAHQGRPELVAAVELAAEMMLRHGHGPGDLWQRGQVCRCGQPARVCRWNGLLRHVGLIAELRDDGPEWSA